MGSTVLAIMIILFALLFGIIALIGIFSYMRSHRLIIRSADSNRILGYYWMMESKDKQDGSIWWKSVVWQKKFKIQEPPDECVDVTQRGKSWVEVWRTSEDEFVFGNGRQLTGTEVLTHDGKKLSELLDPFTKVQRQVVVQQFAKAEDSNLNKKEWTSDKIAFMTVVVGTVMVLTIGLIINMMLMR